MNALSLLIPAPRKARLLGGESRLGKDPRIYLAAGASDGALRCALLLEGEIREKFGAHSRIDVFPSDAGTGVVLSIDSSIAPGTGVCPSPSEAYRMECRGDLVRITGAGEAGLRLGLWTFLRLCRKSRSGLSVPRAMVSDWPALRYRWFMEDLSRGKVPTLETLKQLAHQLAEWKFNGLQLYIEHTFRFRKHPLIGGGWSPLTPHDVRELDAYCRRIGVELVPSLASFGHMEGIFRVKKYRRLSVGEPWRLLMPLKESSYRFLDELYSEYLPCFSSGMFNVNCDETWDLGKGRSAGMVKRLGAGEVYLRHILRLYGLATKKHGKRMMMWGDIIGHHPRLISRLPRDIVVQPWGYFNTWRPGDMKPYARSGMDFLVCPGSCAWHSPSPWTDVSYRNIRSAARTSRLAGGMGIMTTDWGDGGHQQPLGLSVHSIANAAEQSWSGGAARRGDVDRRFSLSVFGDSRGEASRLWRLLGEANHATGLSPVYVMWWYTTNFGLLFYENDLDGKLFKRVRPDGVARLRRIADRAGVLLRSLNRRGAGPELVRRETGYSVRMLAHLASRLAWMQAVKRGKAGPEMRRAGRTLLREIAGLRREFLSLWNVRNRPGRRAVTLALYDKAAAFYRSILGKA